MEIAKVCGPIGLSVAAHNSFCTGHILAFENDEQKTAGSLNGNRRMVGGLGALRRANTGSDAMGMNTTAVLDGDDYIVNGSKTG